ncbi:diaminopimelate epimerase [Rhodoligotrophos defluvii]|uniref:diaminopimelate epimerase n=1 Tax=Rhodoligotrophos defluvii TaxID=2561934 RepID=UPI001484DCB1|nr:diaminopimelate epimerase [Rhodoligotrophos defluvii]
MTADNVAFTKMHGCGNDFIMIDGRNGLGSTALADPSRLTAALCDRRRGLGGDGLILLLPPRGDADFAMLYINATGAPGEMCGNGARCVARFAHDIGAAPSEMRFETEAGPVKAVVGPDHVTIDMPPPRDIRLGMRLTIGGEEREVHFAEVGVPHAVLLVDDLPNCPVDRLGPLVRHDTAFPRGANANFVSTIDGVAMRTFERGVEAETLACGTGAVATATICHLLGLSGLDADIRTRGGDNLSVHLEREGEVFIRATLTGPTETVGQGVVTADFLRSRNLL